MIIREIKKITSPFFLKRSTPELFEKQTHIDYDLALKNAVDWLLIAQSNGKDNGVPATYHLLNKQWGKSYRETTGYIITSLFDYYHRTGKPIYKDQAIKMGYWELSVQEPNGAFGEIHEDGINHLKIFNTGQIIIGLVRLYVETGAEAFKTSMIKAADWLVSNQEVDGTWKNSTTQGPKTYHSRVSWPLLQVFEVTGDERYKAAAIKNLNWVLSCQNQVGWFSDCSLTKSNAPWTHLIAYTIRGILESALILKEEGKKYLDSALLSMDNFTKFSKIKEDKILNATFNEKWLPNSNYSCLTGNAQFAIIYYKLWKITKNDIYLNLANKLVRQLCELQIKSNNKNLNGGITGSYPINGNYCALLIPNWAVKFFADAITLHQEIKA